MIKTLAPAFLRVLTSLTFLLRWYLPITLGNPEFDSLTPRSSASRYLRTTIGICSSLGSAMRKSWEKTSRFSRQPVVGCGSGLGFAGISKDFWSYPRGRWGGLMSSPSAGTRAAHAVMDTETRPSPPSHRWPWPSSCPRTGGSWSWTAPWRWPWCWRGRRHYFNIGEYIGWVVQ